MKKNCSTKMDTKAFEFGKIDENPGPAAYGAKGTVGRRNRMPNIAGTQAYTIKHPLLVNDNTEGPGPMTYNIRRLTRHGKQNEPKCLIGVKLPEIPEDASPGPAAYMVKNAKSHAKPHILLPLVHPNSKAENPGPNVYKLASTLSRKAPTLAKKIEPVDFSDSPGPALYASVPVSKYLQRSPKFTLAQKFEDPLVASELKNPAPGPQAYFPSLKFKYKNTPKFSFGLRRPDKFPPLVVCGDDTRK